MGQKFQHKSKEFFEFGLGDVGLGLWSGVAFTPFGRPVHRHAQAHTTSSSSPTSNSQTVVATMGRLNKQKQQLKRLVEARQARHNKDESGHEEEEVTVFDGKTTVDVDVDAFGEDAIWQEEELEFEDVEELSKDKAEQA